MAEQRKLIISQGRLFTTWVVSTSGWVKVKRD